MPEPFKVIVTVKPQGLWQILEFQIRMKGWKGLRMLSHAVVEEDHKIRVFSCVVSTVNTNFVGIELLYGDFFASAVLQEIESGFISP